MDQQNSRILAAAAAVAVLGFGTAGARADVIPINLVSNFSFEDDGFNNSNLTCPMSSWSGCEGNNAGETSFKDPVLDGHAAYLAIGTAGRLGFISQTIQTVAGQSYQFTFSFSSDGATGNKFQARWGDDVVMDVSNTPFNPAWKTFENGFTYSFLETATSTSTTISFGGQGNGSSYIGVDDVLVTPTKVLLPVVDAHTGNFLFNVNGISAGQPIFIDPAVAAGYHYQIGAGDPNFACVTLPAVQSTPFNVSFADGASTVTASVLANSQFCFPGNGVTAFDVLDIDPAAGLDPSNPLAFVTGLTFAADGDFTGTMTPIVASVPEPASLVLFGTALVGFGGLGRRTRKAA